VIWIDGSKLAGASPSPLMAVIKRIGLAVVCLIMFIGLGSHMPISVLGDSEWLKSHAWYYVLMWNQVRQGPKPYSPRPKQYVLMWNQVRQAPKP
jgi:hypothetical protein